MIKVMVLVVLLPFFATAQPNRSANELAHETIRHYIEHKLFKDFVYAPGKFGQLQSISQHPSNIKWYVKHEFETQKVNHNKEKLTRKHSLIFYLDKKMAVIRAEANENL